MTASARHVPLRRCVVCRASRPQRELLRFYRDGTGMWRHDPKRRAGGRGAWICADSPSCHRVKALRRFFRAQAETVSEALTSLTSLGASNHAQQGGMNV